jgi:hypothetical protein
MSEEGVAVTLGGKLALPSFGISQYFVYKGLRFSLPEDGVDPPLIIHSKLRSGTRAVGCAWARDSKLVIRTVTRHQGDIRWSPIR